jgi:tetratricopeptide (TPR) repeat protein
MRRNFGAEHPNIAGILGNLAALAKDRGDLGAAESRVRESIPMQRKFRGNDHPLLANDLNFLATLLEERGKAAAALPLHEEAVRIYGKHPENPRLSSMRLDHARCLVRLKRFGEAEAETRAADRELNALPESEDKNVRLRSGLRRLAELYDALGKQGEAGRCRTALAGL